MNFEDVREYQPGDEIRAIDWNVTARMGSAFVKKFTEERELTVMLVVDVSASGNFGSTTQSKRELAAEVACLLAFSAIRNNDKVGLLLSPTVSSFSFRRRRVVRTRCVSFEKFCSSNHRDVARSPDWPRLSEQNCDSPFSCIFHLGFSSAGFLAGTRGERTAARFHSNSDPGRTRKIVAKRRHHYFGGCRDGRTDRDQYGRSQDTNCFYRSRHWIRNGAFAHAPAEQC